MKRRTKGKKPAYLRVVVALTGGVFLTALLGLALAGLASALAGLCPPAGAAVAALASSLAFETLAGTVRRP